LKPWEVIRWLG